MAAYNAPWQLGASTRGQDYRTQKRDIQLVGTTQDWAGIVAAGARGKADQNIAAMQVSGAMGRSGIEGTAMLGATALKAQSELGMTGINARTAAYDAKTEADALVEREKAARGPEWIQGAKFAGQIGLLGIGLASM